MVLCQLRFILNNCFDVALIIQKPLEESLLDLLVVFLFEEIVVQELHGAENKQFTAFKRHVESSYGSIGRETNWA